MALRLPRLSDGSMLDFLNRNLASQYAPPPLPMGAPAPPSATGVTAGGFTSVGTTGGGFTSRPSGGFGPSAYGFAGRTGTAGTKGSAPYGFQPEMWRALSAANAAMVRAGLPAFKITDGWRSYAAQVDVKRRKGNLAATPGRSVHGLGLAADLQLNAQQQRWLEQNGHRFGLVRLPSESWHWQLAPSVWSGSRSNGGRRPTGRAANTSAANRLSLIPVGRRRVMA